MSAGSIRIVLAGSVSFSRITLEALLRHGANVVGVLGLDPAVSKDVSDYARLDDVSDVPYRPFTKINAPEIAEQVRQWRPDLLFVVGLSQLAGNDILRVPRMGAIGFHPTQLPQGRGRAPVAWLTFDEWPGAASFFVMEKEADAGAIFVQEPFEVRKGAYATEVIDAVRAAMTRALDRWLPSFLAGQWNPQPQDDSQASFWGRRAAEDGLIRWDDSADAIARLVRTASRPYPGGYTYWRDKKVIVWRASVAELPFRGVTGRILHVAQDGTFLVQTGRGLLRVEEAQLAESQEAPRVAAGQKLGYAAEDEINRLKERIRALEERR
jgi:methionyl-tRNA formyltransferase